MAILKNPKTGKYEIVKSPPSFYKSPKKNGGGSSGGSSSQFSKERIARQQQTDKAIADWKAGKTTQEEAANIVKNIRRGGGSGSASNIAEQEAYAAAEIKAEALRQSAALREAQSKLQSAALREAQSKLQAALIQQKKVKEAQKKLTSKIIVAKNGQYQLPADFYKRYNVVLPDEILRQARTSLVSNIQSTQQINQSIARDVKLGKISQLTANVFDIISGGYVTEKKINNEQAALNNRILKFNDKYTGELTELEYNKATAEKNYLDSEQKRLDKKYNDLISSNKNKVRNFYQYFSMQKNPRLTIQQQEQVIEARKNDIKIQNQIKKNQPLINKYTQKIRQKQTTITQLKNKKNPNILDQIKIFKLNNQIQTLQTDIAALKYEGPPRVYAGTMPIIPASAIPSSITEVRLIGTQRIGANGKITTDILFKTNRGTMGIAKGVSLEKSGNTFSVVGGRFGRVTVKLPSGKIKISKLKTFIGLEKSTTKAKEFTKTDLKKIVNFLNAEKKTGAIRVIQTNIAGLEQAGVGRVAVVGGEKFFKPYIIFPTGRIGGSLSRGISLGDFASISAILKKKDLSMIIGSSITNQGAKAQFLGLIKSLSNTGTRYTLSGGDKQQYSKALQKLFSSVSAAVANAERSGRFATKTLVLAAAAASLSSVTPTVLATKTVGVSLVPKKVSSQRNVVDTIQRESVSKKIPTKISKATKSKTEQLAKIEQVTKQLEKQISKTKQKIKQLSKNKSKQAQRVLARIKQAQRQLQRQLQKLKLQQKLILKQIGFSVTPPFPTIPGKFFLPFAFKLPSGFSRKRLRKAVPGFFVKIKRRGKIVNLTLKPLELREAKSYLAYILDNTLSRSAWIEPMGKSKNVIKIPPKMKGYFSKNSKKFRAYKIKLGKKRGIRMGWIEKKKYFKDMKGERIQLARSRKVKRRLTPTQRKVMLRNLTKVRKMRKNTIQKRPVRRVVKRRPISPARRRQLIKQLQKARAARISGIPQRRNVIKRKPMSPARRRHLIQQLKRARKIRMRNLRK